MDLFALLTCEPIWPGGSRQRTEALSAWPLDLSRIYRRILCPPKQAPPCAGFVAERSNGDGGIYREPSCNPKDGVQAKQVSIMATTNRMERLALLRTYAELSNVVHKPKDVDNPKNDGDHNNGVQDALDGSLHGNIAIHQP